MIKFNKDNFFKFSLEKFTKFKDLLNDETKQILNIKKKKYTQKYLNQLLLEDKKETLLEYLFFINYKEYINANIENIIQNNNTLFLEQLKKIKIYTNKIILNDKLFKRIFHMYLYSVITLKSNLIKLIENSNNDFISKSEIKGINESHYIISQLLILLLKLYTEGKYSLKQILLFLDVLTFYIDKNDIINENYIKIKNIILFELLFNFYGNLSNVLLQRYRYKEDLFHFFNHLTKFLDNDKLKHIINTSILTNNKIIQNFMLILINNIDFSKKDHEDIYNLFKTNIIDNLAQIYDNNINKSNLFEILINQNKESFVNISNYTKNKDNIINDIYKQSFYIELLNKIFENEKISNNKNKIRPPINSFIFNGYDSKLTFKLNKFSLDNSILFFSFQISNQIYNNNCSYPLVIFENDRNDEILFKLFIKSITNNDKSCNKLLIYHNNQNIILDKIQDIYPNNNYFIALYFKNKKLSIYLISANNNQSNKFHQEFDIINYKDNQINMKIGHNDDKKEYFKGYIGSIIFIKNLLLQKDIIYEDIIYNILEMKDFYKYFPYFFSSSTNYNFNNILLYYPAKNEVLFLNKKKYLQTNIKEFECIFYLTPDIIGLYKSLNDKNLPLVYLPDVPNVCESQHFHVILEKNISLTNFDLINIYFVINNGFYYICLIYEYFYQFSNIYITRKANFNFGSKEQNLQKTITNIINKTILILQNYSKCKYIINFEDSIKKLFRNFYECLKSLNILNMINQDILSNLYELVFAYKDDVIFYQNENQIENPNLMNKIVSFSDGLIDILFDIELYKNKNNDDSIEILFLFVSSFFSTFIKEKNKNKCLPFKPEIFWKIINFDQIIDKLFTNDYKNKNKIIKTYFYLLKYFFISIKDSNNCSFYFKKLLLFSLGHLQNNLIIAYNFLCFINEMQWEEGFTFDDEDILILLNFTNKYYIDNTYDSNKKKLIDDIFSVISCILIDLLFNKDSNKIIDKAYETMFIFANNQNILFNITNEIRKIIEGLINNKNKLKFNKINMKFYWKIFNFILNLFKNLITEKEIKIEEKEKENENKEKKTIYKLKDNINYLNLYSLLSNIEKIIREKKDQNKANIQCVYCLFNFIKFYHYIIFNEKNILKFSEKAFIDNLLQVINLITKSFHLINLNYFFQVIIDNCEYDKTIIEIIIEIYFQYFLNNNNSDSSCYTSLLKSQYIFYDNDLDNNKKYTIFYVNDYLRLLLNKKKINEKEKNIIEKYEPLNDSKINFKNEKSINSNFTTSFLLKIGGYQKLLENYNNSDNSFIPKLRIIINKLFDNILEEHFNLAELNKDFFFKSSNSSINYYNQLIQLFKKNIKKKKNCVEEIKKFFENNKQYLTDNIYTMFSSGINIIDKKDNEQGKNKEKRGSINSNSLNEKSDINLTSPKNKHIEIEQFQFPESINNVIYLNDLDKLFLKNPKKEIMNNIFSLYYIDVFFYNEAFCKMRDYYINTYLKSSNSLTKHLDFPSKIKNYSNNLEPPLFLKQYKNFFLDPIFPITYSYINNDNKNIINNFQFIKLFPKQTPIIKEEIKNKFSCELIKIDNYYFGEIILKDSPDCLLFNEEIIDFNNFKEGYKYIFLLSIYNEREQRKCSMNEKSREKFKIKENKKSILIFYDEIEEIIERRVLLLWKAVEIYLKNGKSYFFNFLNTSEYENFINIFKNKDITKNLIRKKEFLRDEKNILEKWEKGLIKNYEYILLLNRYSSRTFNDPNQYPIFPWILMKYSNLQKFNDNSYLFEEALKEHIQTKSNSEELDIDKKNNNNIKNNNKNSKYENIFKSVKVQIRSFKYPPALQTKNKRDISLIKYRDSEISDEFPTHSGCHYSTSSYIYYYLMRQQPFCNLLIKLQGYSLESPNRCFLSIATSEEIINEGNDNRELIPELFSRIEYFLNLNCVFFGILQGTDCKVDDFLIDIFPGYNKKNPLSIYVHFILQNKKFLNSKIIGYHINKWIDNVFGINQLPPEKLRINSFNIFNKYSYEQLVNLENKLNKKINKNTLSETQIKEKINIIINCIVNFGQTPYQIFHIKHPKLNIALKNEIINNSKTNNNKNTELIEDDEDDLESIINNSLRNQELVAKIDGTPLYFQINPSINKIFTYNSQGNIIILNCQIFNKLNYPYYQLSYIFTLHNINIFHYGLVNKNSKYSIFKLKYAFSSFYNDELKESDFFHTNYSDIINEKEKTNIINKIKEKAKLKQDKKENEIITIITCRHIDFSFKIHLYKLKNKNKKESLGKVYSFICEDFVTSCCVVSSKQFLLGLNNGKLILCSIKTLSKIGNDKNNSNNKIIYDDFEDITIKYERYIQGHRGKINVIEIDKRVGVIITSGDDNYICLRKLYDFELLLPIQLKSKYIVLMAMISTFNFLYILCFNNIRNKTIIFGYTLSGLKFAKSEYGLYDNISFTENGNLVTMNNKKEVIVLSGSDLSRINMKEDDESMKKINEIKGSNWMQFDCFMRKDDDDMSKIITFLSSRNNNINTIQTLDVRNIKYFD